MIKNNFKNNKENRFLPKGKKGESRFLPKGKKAENRFLPKGKKANFGATLTWIVATSIIVFLIIIFLILMSGIKIIEKKDINVNYDNQNYFMFNNYDFIKFVSFLNYDIQEDNSIKEIILRWSDDDFDDEDFIKFQFNDFMNSLGYECYIGKIISNNKEILFLDLTNYGGRGKSLQNQASFLEKGLNLILFSEKNNKVEIIIYGGVCDL